MTERLDRTRYFIALTVFGLGCSGLSDDGAKTTSTGRGGTGGTSSTSSSTGGSGGGGTTSAGGGGAPSTTTGNGGASGSATTSGTAGSGGSGQGGGGNGGSGGTVSSGGGGGATDGGAGTGGAGGSSGACVPGADGGTQRFSFFVTSLVAMRALSGSQNGFGGDLRFGKADGLSGADEICRQTAERSMPGSSCKNWRAFLSVTKGPNGTPVHAIDRIGEGPWYDRRGRIVAMTKADLQQTRPRGADPAIINDLPNEDGVPNHAPEGNMQVDNHDILTGSNTMGQVYNMDWSNTCHDWTSTVPTDGKPRCGHSWPRGTQSWISILNEAGCAAGVNVVEMGGPNPNDPTVGSGGGYGAIYCFALIP
jgi:hypothetical protein